jgi:KDO2-lipid IV(A) lauroyltransferase
MLWLLSAFFRFQPLALALFWGRCFGFLWFHLFPIRRGVALQNVDRVFGDKLSRSEKRRMVRRCFQHFGMYGVEILRLPSLSKEKCSELVERRNFNTVLEAYARGKGVIAATAHVGNFDLLGCSQAMMGLRLSVIFKDIEWKPAHRFWMKIREKTGIEPIAPRRSKEEIKRALGEGRIVAFITDQHMAKHRAIVTDFFGQLASTSPAPVRFAMETGAPIVPAVMYRDKKHGHHHIHSEPEFELEFPHETEEENIFHNTQRLNRIMEKLILREPDQWLWMHKRWKVQDAPEGWDIPPQLQNLLRQSS